MGTLRKIFFEVSGKALGLAWSNFRLVLKWWITYVGGAFGSLWSFKTNVFEKYPFVRILLAFFVLAFSLFLLLFLRFFFIESWRKYILLRRESIYGNAIVLLSQSFSKLHSLRKKKTLEKKEVKDVLEAFCDNLSAIYEKKTKSKCGVSIKVFSQCYSDLNFQSEVFTLCRNENTRSRYTNRVEPIHTIARNTGYQRILSNFYSDKKDQLYFLCNDLPGYGEYDNSSFDVYPALPDDAKRDVTIRRDKWPLEYKSELIVALTPMEPENVTEFHVVGFLCIDCKLDKGEIFEEKYDVALVRGVADGVYDLIKNYFFIKTQEDGSHNSSHQEPKREEGSLDSEARRRQIIPHKKRRQQS
ncbi:MAG: hypothetical protein HY842_00360 [Bacteroidetes bacterium]|nr:hypothetical protein [Bacteroidota bacterium]